MLPPGFCDSIFANKLHFRLDVIRFSLTKGVDPIPSRMELYNFIARTLLIVMLLCNYNTVINLSSQCYIRMSHKEDTINKRHLSYDQVVKTQECIFFNLKNPNQG